MTHSPRLSRCLLLGVLGLLVWAAQSPTAAVSWDVTSSTGLTGPVVAVVGLLAWACLSWLLVVTCLLALADRGVTAARLLVARLAPASLRAVLSLAVGGTLVAGAMAPAALAAPAAGVVAPGPAGSLGWPREAATPSAQPAREPTLSPSAPSVASPPRRLAAPASPAPVRRPPAVVVQPGDSLWTIARQSLGGTPTVQQISASWPSWWHANRAVIGADPDLIRPGTSLSPPS